MTPAYLAEGLPLVAVAVVVFALAFAVHVAVWRVSPATPSGLVLIVLLSAVVLLQCLVAGAMAAASALETPLSTIVVVGVLALQFTACYAISYPAMQANSPSLEIARHLAAAGERGLAREDLYGQLTEASLVRDRIEDLIKDHLAVEEGGCLRCTRRGAALARLFASWKALLREPKGG
jgi:hypothetical protein